MSQKYDFGGEEDFFASGYSNSGAAKKNFFDFEDEEPTESLSGLPESSSSLSTRAQPPKTPPSSGFSQKKSVLPHGAISSSSSSFSNELPSNSSSLFDFKCNNAARKVAELVELTIGGDRGPSTSSSFSPTSTTTSTTTLSPRMAIEKLASAETDHQQSNSQQINLSVFRGKEQKLELLDYALLTGRPYVITRVILFLRETLKASLFHYEISRRPVASDHYLLFLRNTGEGAQEGATVQESLARLGRHEEAAFATYARAIKAGGFGAAGGSSTPPSANQAESQIRLLKKALQGFTSGGAEVLQWGPYIRDQIALLEQQLPIEADDRRREAEEIGRLQDPKVHESSSSSQTISTSTSSSSSSNLFVLFPRPPLIGLSVLETLHYCCRYHYLLADNNFASPVYLRKRYGLSERQFLWTALQALSKSAMWPEIDTLFEYKSWLGSRKIKNCIPIEDIVGVLYRHSAPPEMLEKYLELIEDTERRLALAKELLMVKFAADILIKLKDRKRLSELRAAIQTSQDVDYVQRYIDNVLRTSTIKWKN